MPPPHTGSSRPRRESERDHEDVFDDDKATSPKATPPRKDDVKMMAAPAPKENVWARRKAGQTPPSAGPAKSDSTPTSPSEQVCYHQCSIKNAQVGLHTLVMWILLYLFYFHCILSLKVNLIHTRGRKCTINQSVLSVST